MIKRDTKFIWLYREEPVNVNYHPTNFGGHRYCGSRDIMILVCHMISQDHVIKGKGYVTYNVQTHQDKLQSYQFGSHRHMIVEI